MTEQTREGLEVFFKGLAVGLAVIGWGAVLTNNNWLGLLFFGIASATSFFISKTFATRREE